MTWFTDEGEGVRAKHNDDVCVPISWNIIVLFFSFVKTEPENYHYRPYLLFAPLGQVHWFHNQQNYRRSIVQYKDWNNCSHPFVHLQSKMRKG